MQCVGLAVQHDAVLWVQFSCEPPVGGIVPLELALVLTLVNIGSRYR